MNYIFPEVINEITWPDALKFFSKQKQLYFFLFLFKGAVTL